MFEQFTDRARRAFMLAHQEAQKLSHEYIGPEHLLVGLVKEGGGVAAYILKECGITPERVILEIHGLSPPATPTVVFGRLPQTPELKKAVERAIEFAREKGNNYVGTEHLIVGLLKDENNACKILRNLGTETNLIDKQVNNLLTHVDNEPGFKLDRDTLRNIIEAALKSAQELEPGNLIKEAFMRLASSADALDAYMVRATLKPPP